MASNRLFLLSVLTFVLFSKTHSYSLQSACELADDPKSCHSSLLQADPTSSTASPKNLTLIALKKSLSRVEKVYDLIPPLGWAGRAPFDRKSSPAIADCLTFYDLAIKHLKDAQVRLYRSGSADLKWIDAMHIQTLLSAAHTNHRTCERELQHGHVNLSQFTFTDAMNDASVAVSDSMALVNKLWIMGKAPTYLKRRLLSDGDDHGMGEDGFMPWRASRRLLQTSQTDAIVAQDGSGRHRTIGEAIAAAPANNPHRYVIRIKAGVYRESVEVPYNKPNIMFVGDGIHATVITTAKNTADGYAMTKTAAVAVFANGFVARDLTFQNTAGPKKDRGLALLVVSDKAAFYRCRLDGYQDTLYAYSMRQFYRDCEIYGTIDFICGNPSAVFQKCSIHLRTPIPGQQNVITAQDRVHQYDITAIVLDNCKIAWSNDAKSHSAKTYLGRPWGSFARTIVMNSRLGGLIDPVGWLSWGGRDDSKTVYFGEYKNSGPGADTRGRCKWPGFHLLNDASASPFTSSALLRLRDWLPSGIPENI